MPFLLSKSSSTQSILMEMPTKYNRGFTKARRSVIAARVIASRICTNASTGKSIPAVTELKMTRKSILAGQLTESVMILSKSMTGGMWKSKTKYWNKTNPSVNQPSRHSREKRERRRKEQADKKCVYIFSQKNLLLGALYF